MAIRDYDRLFIGGDCIAPEGTGTIGVVSPSTEEVIARVPDGTEADIDKAVAAARAAFDRGPWPRMTPTERGAILTKVAAQITAEMGDLAEIITAEMGSPISFAAMGQVLAPSMVFGYYADMASTFAFDEVRTGLLNPSVLVTKEPVGVWEPLLRGTCPFHCGGEAGAVTVGRVHGRLQAGSRDPLGRLPPGRDLYRLRAAQGCALGRTRRARGQRAPGHARGRGQDLLHRVGRRGQAHRWALR